MDRVNVTELLDQFLIWLAVAPEMKSQNMMKNTTLANRKCHKLTKIPKDNGKSFSFIFRLNCL